jgi:hypothetical protein
MVSARSGGKGLDFEEALRTYFAQAGYFVIRGVPYLAEDEHVTDIDLWLYERPGALTRRRLIVDAKNRGRPKAAERIIWSNGLRAALGVDGAIVATTDNRLTTKALAKSMGVVLLAGDAVTRLAHSEKLKNTDRFTSEEFNGTVKRIDEGRRSGEWRQHLLSARRSLIGAFGMPSANGNLAHGRFFAEQASIAQPQSDQAQFAIRLFYLTSALAAISLDFALADQAFRSPEQRRQSIIDGVRFGIAEGASAASTIRAAIGLARKYADNGTAVAKQIEYGFNTDADRIPAEIIADYVSRTSASDALFNCAREVEDASSSIELPSYDDLSIETRSLLGAFLDFHGIAREKIATAWSHRRTTPPAPESAVSLFSGPGGPEAGEPKYSFHYVADRASDHALETRISGATRLESLIASAMSQFPAVKTVRPSAIGFFITDEHGNIVHRWYEDDVRTR